MTRVLTTSNGLTPEESRYYQYLDDLKSSYEQELREEKKRRQKIIEWNYNNNRLNHMAELELCMKENDACTDIRTLILKQVEYCEICNTYMAEEKYHIHNDDDYYDFEDFKLRGYDKTDLYDTDDEDSGNMIEMVIDTNIPYV